MSKRTHQEERSEWIDVARSPGMIGAGHIFCPAGGVRLVPSGCPNRLPHADLYHCFQRLFYEGEWLPSSMV
jgi:hypothetical protein